MTRLSYTRGTLASGSGPEGELVFTASAEGVNRYGFSLNRRRWRIDNFNNNPVILWMHDDRRPPIGRGRAVIDSQGLKTSVTFDRSDPFAVEIERKYREGFLNAVSVGFDFVDRSGAPVPDPWNLTPDMIYNEVYYDLAEVSAVPVPADPNALIRQRHALAADFGLIVPEEQRDDFRSWVSRWSGFDPYAPRQTYMINPWPGALATPAPAPVIPADLLWRLESLEAKINQLAAPAVAPAPADADEGEPDDEPGAPEDQAPDDKGGEPASGPDEEASVDETAVSALLNALKL